MFKSQLHADEALSYSNCCGHTYNIWGRLTVSPDRPEKTGQAHASPSSLVILILPMRCIRMYTYKRNSETSMEKRSQVRHLKETE